MKIVLQRVSKACVYHEKQTISQIKNGYVLLVGISKNEEIPNIEKIVKKILKIKLFQEWKMNIVDMDYEIMVLSQFTLFAQFKGTKPDFHLAEDHLKAKILFEKVVDEFRIKYQNEKIKHGIFGQHLEIELVNDGPVTILLEE